MLKESANFKSSSDVNLSMFERYFKAINNSSDPFFTRAKMIYFNERYVQSELQIMFSELTLEITLVCQKLSIQCINLNLVVLVVLICS